VQESRVKETASDTVAEIADTLRRAGVDAAVHARALGAAGEGARQVGLAADQPVASASTYKVLVLLELACQVAEGRVSPTSRLRVPPEERTLGPTGLSVLQDDVELSVRDLALLMMQISDNTATDVVQRLVGTEAIGRRLEALGLHRTVVESDCAGLLAMLLDELGGDVDALDPAELAAALAASPSLNAVRGNRTTPREMTRLLDLVWTDRAGPPEACAEVRRVMGLQHAPHRLATAYLGGPRSGWADGPVISGKTGTLYGGLRSEVGVVDFDGEERYAVAVYVRATSLAMRNAAADRVIGDVARIAVDSLRGR
jgi:beta-lactamase class A